MITLAALRLSDRNKRCTMGVLRRPELFGRMLGETTEDGQRGQTGFGREPALDVGEMRIEAKAFSCAFCMAYYGCIDG